MSGEICSNADCLKRLMLNEFEGVAEGGKSADFVTVLKPQREAFVGADNEGNGS